MVYDESLSEVQIKQTHDTELLRVTGATAQVVFGRLEQEMTANCGEVDLATLGRRKVEA